jgi:hypothetical protein
MTLVTAGAAVVLAVVVAGALLARRQKPGSIPHPAKSPLVREPDFFDAAFSLPAITRRAREEAALAGRAAAEGRPIAHRLEDLPSRRWIAERIEERISELRRDQIAALAKIDEQCHRLARETADHQPARDALRARVNELAKLQRAEVAKTRHEQDLAVERRLEEARGALRGVENQLRASETRQEELAVRRDRLPAETDAEIAYLREACDTLEIEHDMAYEAAEHRHPDKEPITAPAVAAAPSAAMPLVAITEGARREGAIAGRAAAAGIGPSALDELPSRRWITERFAEHIAAVKAQGAVERRTIGEELAVIAEHIREADRAEASAQTLIASLAKLREQAGAADRVPEHDRRVQLAERTLRTAQGRRHDHELLRERLTERERRSDADHDARIEFFNEALAAAIAEHDLAFHTAATAATHVTPNGSMPGPFRGTGH